MLYVHYYYTYTIQYIPECYPFNITYRISLIIYAFCYFIFLDGFTSFRDAFPEWCEDESTNVDSQTHRGTSGPTEQLMGLR